MNGAEMGLDDEKAILDIEDVMHLLAKLGQFFPKEAIEELRTQMNAGYMARFRGRDYEDRGIHGRFSEGPDEPAVDLQLRMLKDRKTIPLRLIDRVSFDFGSPHDNFFLYMKAREIAEYYHLNFCELSFPQYPGCRYHRNIDELSQEVIESGVGAIIAARKKLKENIQTAYENFFRKS